MEIKKYKILIVGLLLVGVTYVAADDCPCDGVTEGYFYDCDKDDVMESCEPCEDSCETTAIDPRPGYECCNGIPHNTQWSGNYSESIDFSNIIHAINGTLGNIPGGNGCRFPNPSVSGGISYQTKEECCGGAIETLSKYSGDVSFGPLGIQCQFMIPELSVPSIAETSVVMGVSASGKVSLERETTCGESRVCGDISMDFFIDGGADVNVLDDAVGAKAVLVATTQLSSEYCSSSGWSGVNACISRIVGDFEVDLGFGAYELHLGRVLWGGDC